MSDRAAAQPPESSAGMATWGGARGEQCGRKAVGEGPRDAELRAIEVRRGILSEDQSRAFGVIMLRAGGALCVATAWTSAHGQNSRPAAPEVLGGDVAKSPKQAMQVSAKVKSNLACCGVNKRLLRSPRHGARRRRNPSGGHRRADFDDHVRRRQPVIYRPWPDVDVTALADDISRRRRVRKRLPTQFPPPRPALPPPPFDAFLSYLASYIGLTTPTARLRGAHALRALVHFRHRPALPGGGAGDGRARQHHAHRRNDRGHRLLDLERRLRDWPALGRLRPAQPPLLGLRREGGVRRRSRPVRGALLRRWPALPHALRRRRRSDAARRSSSASRSTPSAVGCAPRAPATSSTCQRTGGTRWCTPARTTSH